MLTFDQTAMLQKAGYTPCWVGDLTDGDEIALEHHLKPNQTTIMTVSASHQRPNSGGPDLMRWIGTLPDGVQLHCAYAVTTECWRLHQAEADHG